MRFPALLFVALSLWSVPVRAQTVFVPGDEPGSGPKLDLALQDQQLLLKPQPSMPLDRGPYRIRFQSPALDSLLAAPPAVTYVSTRGDGLLLRVLHLRRPEVPPSALGPQGFEVLGGDGESVGGGLLVVVASPPEAVELHGEEGARTLTLGREARIRLRLRPHGNYAGNLRVANARDFELTRTTEEGIDSTGLLTVSATLRPLREEARELRLQVETRDGRDVELTFGDLQVRAPAPRRVRIGGGPVHVDASGSGAGRIVVLDLPPELVRPEIQMSPPGEITVLEQRFDRDKGVLEATVELTGRTALAPGARETRELRVRAGDQVFRGTLDIAGPPLVSSVRVEGRERAVLPIGGGAVVLRVGGRNLEGLVLDCTALPGTTCRTLSSAPDELVARISLGPDVREGEHPLRVRAADPAHPPNRFATVGVRTEYPSVPVPLAGARFLRVGCGGAAAACRPARDGESLIARAGRTDALRLQFVDSGVPREHGWQKLLVTVTRVRGEQRQIVRTVGTPAAPRMLRTGTSGGEVTLLDPGADARHGDLFVVRVEHAVDQYPPEYRAGLASSESFVRRVYIDGGLAKRFTGDIVVQPVLFALGADSSRMRPLYPNAGLGVTWQFLNARMEPRAYSIKLQALLTNLQSTEKGRMPGQPALFASANLRIPGSDPNRPLVLTGGLARMLGDEPGWRVLMGAGIDLGVAHMIFGR